MKMDNSTEIDDDDNDNELNYCKLNYIYISQ